jgi:hypothetical protein
MEVIEMAERQQAMERTAKQWVGQLVCVALNDGSYYVGKVTDVRKGELFLAGVKGKRKITGRKSLKKQVKVSGLLGSLFGGFGLLRPFFGGGKGLFRGGADGASRGGTDGASSGGGLGFFGKIIPGIRIGFKMMKFIWPLFSKL